MAIELRSRNEELAKSLRLHAHANLPTCRECKRVVDHIDTRYDPADGTITVRVRCHRESSERVVSAVAVRDAMDLHEMGPLVDAVRRPWFFMPPPGPEVP